MTTTTTNWLPAPTSCGNQGVNAAVWFLPTQNCTETYDSSCFGNGPANISTTASYFGEWDDLNGDWEDLFGYSGPSDNTGVMQTGYLYAPTTGTFTLGWYDVDDYAALWTGPSAYSGFDATNWNLAVISPDAGPQSTTVDLEEGQY